MSDVSRGEYLSNMLVRSPHHERLGFEIVGVNPDDSVDITLNHRLIKIKMVPGGKYKWHFTSRIMIDGKPHVEHADFLYDLQCFE